MNYIEVKLMPTEGTEEICDVLASLLGPLGFDSFSTEAEEASGTMMLKAYITENLWDQASLDDLLQSLPIEGVEVPWVASVVEMQDWNQEWEQSMQFEPIVVRCQPDGAAGEVTVCVHSPAAQADQLPECRYEVIIDPRMSFGSGTHETTSQLLEEILSVAHDTGVSTDATPTPRALDMGTGTGVLGILCAELGYEVRAIEIDDWVTANAIDNVLYNGLAGKMQVECGDAALLTEGPTYQLVLANINRNVLLSDMARYVSVMLPDATLLMSGFYEEDVAAIRSCAEALGLKYKNHRNRNGWVVIRFAN